MRKKQIKSVEAKSHSRNITIQPDPNGALQKSAPLHHPPNATSGETYSAGGGTKRWSIKELEKYRDFAAFVVVEYGPQFGFALERVEQMLEQAKEDQAKDDDVVERARKILANADLKKLPNGTIRRR